MTDGATSRTPDVARLALAPFRDSRKDQQHLSVRESMPPHQLRESPSTAHDLPSTRDLLPAWRLLHVIRKHGRSADCKAAFAI